jgi:hypothetical protein
MIFLLFLTFNFLIILHSTQAAGTIDLKTPRSVRIGEDFWINCTYHFSEAEILDSMSIFKDKEEFYNVKSPSN